jgi:hypothetical protein
MSVLNLIAKEMDALEINYDFEEWKGEPQYPYATGEYQEVESLQEDGEQETQFILNVFARGITAHADLEAVKNKIKKHFPKVGGRLATTESGSRVAIFYANTLGNLPTGDAELKRIQINLKIKEWSVE